VWFARYALNQSALVERDNHAMDGGGRDAEEREEVTLCRRAPVQGGIGVMNARYCPWVAVKGIDMRRGV
jgi:hypothetical protein